MHPLCISIRIHIYQRYIYGLVSYCLFYSETFEGVSFYIWAAQLLARMC